MYLKKRYGIPLNKKENDKLSTLQQPDEYQQEDLKQCHDELAVAIHDRVQEKFEEAKVFGSDMPSFWLPYMEIADNLMMNVHFLSSRQWDDLTISNTIQC